uniref:Uncharacterized protein n=2 Tax=Timema TaxID=61471 RepID=A0A7R9HEY0_TIMPO|nr:unnamed protein product [Timema douglasi]CAD7416867.1 unnamed protein product [Timema poppensis]
MLKAMCEGQVGGNVPLPLRHCDIYGSKEAGTKLRSMMSLGSSKPWQEALRVMTGETDYSAGPLLEYYQPLFEWLVRYAQQHHLIIGWQE